MSSFYFFETVFLSCLLYLFFHKKAKISLNFLYKDNLVVIFFTLIVILLLGYLKSSFLERVTFILIPILIVTFFLIIFWFRFWRTPKRKCNATENQVVSPADGNVIYIKRVESRDIPVSIKNGVSVKLEELLKTNILNGPCWLIGINMTPFDVHKNCAPVKGKVILNKHFNGKFLSLKNPEALVQNERNTIVIKNADGDLFGVVQTASRLVRRIDTYISEGIEISQGDWYGMIRFGSQVDIILPIAYIPKVKLKEQVYAIETIIAEK